MLEKTIKRLFTSQRRRFWTSEFAAISSSYTLTMGASELLSMIGLSNQANAIASLAVKTLSFWGVNLGTYAFGSLEYGQRRQALRKDIISLLQTNLLGSAVALSIKSTGAYVQYRLLEAGVDPYLAPLLAYPLPGGVASGMRYVINWHQGILPSLFLDGVSQSMKNHINRHIQMRVKKQQYRQYHGIL